MLRVRLDSATGQDSGSELFVQRLQSLGNVDIFADDGIVEMCFAPDVATRGFAGMHSDPSNEPLSGMLPFEFS